mmetsp:Transcript_79216/g.183823  ORF Transcript_79216/g.183823 Transcript_79216/m.183823 type:complete len:235 (-) Transcript_79216:716-1420(-)
MGLSQLDKHRGDIITVVPFLVAPPLPRFSLKLLDCPFRTIALDFLCHSLHNKFRVEKLPNSIAGKDEERLLGKINLSLSNFRGCNNTVGLHRLVAQCPSHTKPREVLALHENAVIDPAVRIRLGPHLASVRLYASLFRRTVWLVISRLKQHLAIRLVANNAPRISHIGGPHSRAVPKSSNGCRAACLNVPPFLKSGRHDVFLGPLKSFRQGTFHVVWEVLAVHEVVRNCLDCAR